MNLCKSELKIIHCALISQIKSIEHNLYMQGLFVCPPNGIKRVAELNKIRLLEEKVRQELKIK